MADPPRRSWLRCLPVLAVVLAAGTTVALLTPPASGQGDGAGTPPVATGATGLTTPAIDTSAPTIDTSTVAGATTIASTAATGTLPVSAVATAPVLPAQEAGDLTGPAPLGASSVVGATTIQGPPAIDPALAVIVTEAGAPPLSAADGRATTPTRPQGAAAAPEQAGIVQAGTTQPAGEPVAPTDPARIQASPVAGATTVASASAGTTLDLTPTGATADGEAAATAQAPPQAQVDPAAASPVQARTVEAATVALSSNPEDQLVKFYVPGGVVHPAVTGLILPADQATFTSGEVYDVHAAKVQTRAVAGCVDGGAVGGVAGVGFGGLGAVIGAGVGCAGLGTLQALATEVSEPAEWVVRDPVSGRLDKGLHCTPSGARPTRQLDPGSGQPTGFWVLPPADCTAKTAAVAIPGRTLPASGLQPPDFAPVDAGWRVGDVPADFLAPFPGAQLVVPAAGGALPPVLGWETERAARAVVGGLPSAAADVGLSVPAPAPDLTAGFLGAELQSLILEGSQNPVLTWRHPASGALTQCRYERDVIPSGRAVTYRWCSTDVEPVRIELPGLVETAVGWGLDEITEGMVNLFTSTLVGP